MTPSGNQNNKGPKGQSSKKGGGGTTGLFVHPCPDAALGRTDMGVDFSAGKLLQATGDGVIVEIGSPGWPNGGAGPAGQGWVLKMDHKPDVSPSTNYVYYYEGLSPSVKKGDRVKAGQTVGRFYPGSSIEIGFWDPGSGNALAAPHYSEGDVTQEGQAFLKFIQNAAHMTASGAPLSSGSGGAGTFSESDLFAIGRASAISTQLQLPGLLNMAKSIWMTGAKSIYNDEPLMGFIQQLCQASLRNFQSLPNGAFFAFFPDQFGLYGHRKPYWEIDDIEIIDGGIQLNDESLATHVFVVGDTLNPDGVSDISEMAASKGVITIFDAFTSNAMINLTSDQKPTTKETKKGDPKNKKENLQNQLAAVNFLKKYGVRPLYKEATFIRNSFFEIFYAFTLFQIAWANQYRTTFSFTFMPELYPGGIVAFQDHGFQCYIDSVTHSFDYTSGFTTQANLSAPSALEGTDNAIAHGMTKPFVDQVNSPGFQLQQHQGEPPKPPKHHHHNRGGHGGGGGD